MRRGGVRAAATYRLPRPRRAGRSAVTQYEREFPAVLPCGSIGQVDVYSPFMTEDQRDLPAIVDSARASKLVVPQRLTVINDNQRNPSAAKAGVAVSNPAGGTSEAIFPRDGARIHRLFIAYGPVQ
jgi:hypothetical protein